ncbi:hypothetical protein MRB53_016164 [Persea americana]|uniref:Uncharacterized protein n=1 Tax=Persea americana TaxID=3435 RepID=A0ACC2M1F1_PERAE|nr:hypothetical protein MRB53_016164 [Persea americana]
MDFVAGIAGKVVDFVAGKVVEAGAQHFGYIKDLKRNFEQLNEEATTLQSKKEDMEREINRDRISKRPKGECQDWIKKVDDVHNKVDAVNEEYSKEDNTRWWLPTPSKWMLGKTIIETTNQILELIKDSNFEGGMVVDALPQITETKPVLTIQEKDENKEDVMISGGIISRLSQLEQLSIFLGFDDPKFGRYGNKWGKCAKVVMNDVSCLKRLMSLAFWFPKMEYLECFLQGSDPWKKGIITSFNFIVGQHGGSSSTVWFGCLQERERQNRMLTLCGYDSITNAIIVVLSHANTFTLFGQRRVQSLCEFGMQNMIGLIRCNIAECNAMVIVMDGNRLTRAALPNLEELYVSYMPNLRSTWEGSFPPESLNCLKTLELLKCEKLKNIFSQEIIQRLSNLERLRVESCSALEEVIFEEEIGVEFDCVLPKLRHLQLSHLPALRSILKGHQLLKWSSLEEISVVSCCNLKRLPVSISTTPKLRRIDCERKWWNELEWDDNGIKLQLQQLCRWKNEQHRFRG